MPGMTSSRSASPRPASLAALVDAERAPVARMLRALAGASIAATLGAASGCGPDPRFSHEEFEAPACTPGGQW
jgi:hypothetical protein